MGTTRGDDRISKVSDGTRTTNRPATVHIRVSSMRKKEVKTCGRAFTRRIKSKKKKKRLITYAKLVPPHRQSLGAVVDLWKYFVRSADECEPFVFLRFLPCSPFPPRPAPTRPSSYSSSSYSSSSGSPLIVRCEGYRRLFIN